MKTDFYKKLKEFIISEHEGDKYFIRYVRHYETLFQHKETLKPLLDDCEKWNIDILYQDDSTGGYTYGKYQIYLWNYDEELSEDDIVDSYYYDRHSPAYYYEIELTVEERHWGYCDCTSEMELYNPKYDCCGNGCDFNAPSFTLSKIQGWSGSFKGNESDLWKLEEKWEEHLVRYNEKVKQEKLKRINDQLKRLQKERECLLN